MSKVIKLRFSNFYVFFGLIFPTLLSLFLTATIVFGITQREPTKDLPPLVSLDVLFLFLAILSVKQYFALSKNGQTALELNEGGITYTILNINIRWDNVSDIRLVQKGVNSFIAIDSIDKKIVISQTKNPFKKLYFYLNILLYGTPIILPTLYIEGANSAIFEKVQAYFSDKS